MLGKPHKLAVRSPRANPVNNLQATVSNLIQLYQKSKLYHWNVTGENFFALHKLFDEIQEIALDAIDEVGERIRVHHHDLVSNQSSEVWFKSPVITTESVILVEDMLSTLEATSEKLNTFISEGSHSEVESSLLQDICLKVDKHLYFIRSSL